MRELDATYHLRMKERSSIFSRAINGCFFSCSVSIELLIEPQPRVFSFSVSIELLMQTSNNHYRNQPGWNTTSHDYHVHLLQMLDSQSAPPNIPDNLNAHRMPHSKEEQTGSGKLDNLQLRKMFNVAKLEETRERKKFHLSKWKGLPGT